jgi:hypothetical protein
MLNFDPVGPTAPKAIPACCVIVHTQDLCINAILLCQSAVLFVCGSARI